MSDSLATVETIVMSAGPQSLDIKFDVGPEGERGSYFYVGTGSPDEYDFGKVYSEDYPIAALRGNLIYDKVPQEFDWYVNLLPGHETYLTVYQFKYPGQTNPWEIVFKLIPNVVSKTFDGADAIDFGVLGSPTAGMAQIGFTASDLELPLPQKFLGDSGIPENAISVANEVEMLEVEFSFAPSSSNPGYVYRVDKSAFYKTFDSDYSDIESWEKHLSISVDLDIENFYPIAKSFNVQMPTYDGTTYSFIIDVTAVNLDVNIPAWIPLVGTKKTHLTLTVI